MDVFRGLFYHDDVQYSARKVADESSIFSQMYYPIRQGSNKMAGRCKQIQKIRVAVLNTKDIHVDNHFHQVDVAQVHGFYGII